MSVCPANFTDALESGRYALVGAGQLGAMSLRLWPASIARPEFLLDSYRKGSLDEIEIRDLRSHRPTPGITYLASVFTIPPTELKEIFRELGQPDLLTVYDFFQHFSPAIFSNGWRNLDPSPETEQRLSKLPLFYADETSRRTCEAALAWRYRRQLLNDYPLIPTQAKYDLSLFGRAGTHYDVVYDAGCFDFGLPTWLASANITFDNFLAFEPDPKSRAVCLDRIEAHRPHTTASITADARALSDTSRKARFLANGLLAARLINDASLAHSDMLDVETTTLDAVHGEMFGWAASPPPRILIKLHIEAAEFPALKGAEKLVRTCPTDLLINLSHDEPSLLDIPEWIARMGSHDQFLRSYSLFGEGLTLFARHRSLPG